MARAVGNGSRARWGLWIATIVAGVYALAEIAGVSKHVHEPTWPHHAAYHAVTGLFDLVTLLSVAVALLWTHVRRGDRTAWWVVSVIGIAIFGGALVADPISSHGLTGGGEALVSPSVSYALVISAFVLWIVAMGLTRPPYVRNLGPGPSAS